MNKRHTYQVFTSSSVYLTLGIGCPLHKAINAIFCDKQKRMDVLFIVHSDPEELLSSFPIHRIFKTGMIGVQFASVHQNVLSVVELRNFSRKPRHLVEILINVKC